MNRKLICIANLYKSLNFYKKMEQTNKQTNKLLTTVIVLAILGTISCSDSSSSGGSSADESSNTEESVMTDINASMSSSTAGAVSTSVDEGTTQDYTRGFVNDHGAKILVQYIGDSSTESSCVDVKINDFLYDHSCRVGGAADVPAFITGLEGKLKNAVLKARLSGLQNNTYNASSQDVGQFEVSNTTGIASCYGSGDSSDTAFINLVSRVGETDAFTVNINDSKIPNTSDYDITHGMDCDFENAATGANVTFSNVMGFKGNAKTECETSEVDGGGWTWEAGFCGKD